MSSKQDLMGYADELDEGADADEYSNPSSRTTLTDDSASQQSGEDYNSDFHDVSSDTYPDNSENLKTASLSLIELDHDDTISDKEYQSDFELHSRKSLSQTASASSKIYSSDFSSEEDVSQSGSLSNKHHLSQNSYSSDFATDTTKSCQSQNLSKDTELNHPKSSVGNSDDSLKSSSKSIIVFSHTHDNEQYDSEFEDESAFSSRRSESDGDNSQVSTNYTGASRSDVSTTITQSYSDYNDDHNIEDKNAAEIEYSRFVLGRLKVSQEREEFNQEAPSFKLKKGKAPAAEELQYRKYVLRVLNSNKLISPLHESFSDEEETISKNHYLPRRLEVVKIENIVHQMKQKSESLSQEIKEHEDYIEQQRESYVTTQAEKAFILSRKLQLEEEVFNEKMDNHINNMNSVTLIGELARSLPKPTEPPLVIWDKLNSTAKPRFQF